MGEKLLMGHENILYKHDVLMEKSKSETKIS